MRLISRCWNNSKDHSRRVSLSAFKGLHTYQHAVPRRTFWLVSSDAAIFLLLLIFFSLCADSLFLFLLTGELSCFCSLLFSSASHLSYRFFVSGGPHAWLMACCLEVIFICSTLLQPAFVCRRCPLLTHSATPVLVMWKCGVPLLPLSPKWSWFIERQHRLL